MSADALTDDSSDKGAGSSVNVPQGVYANSIEKTITLTRDDDTIELRAGQSGFADAPRLNRLPSTPLFLANDPTPPPGAFPIGYGCSALTPYQMLSKSGDDRLASDWLNFEVGTHKEIKYFLEQGYPPTSVLLHAISMGVTLDQSLYLAIRADQTRAQDFYTAAADMAASLPGWVCGTSVVEDEYSPTYDVNDLSSPRTVREVAERYFESNRRLFPFPSWPDGDFHMLATVDELLEMARGNYWYRPGPPQRAAGGNPRDSVFISLYKHDKSIVIDTAKSELRRLKQAGVDRVPVIFFYNRDYQRPVSELPDNTDIERVLGLFFDNGLELTPVPMWSVGDHHITVDADQLTQLFDIPERDEIPKQRLARLTAELQDENFERKPIMVSLLRDGRYRRLAEPDRVRAAIDLGLQQFPLTFFYHRVDRQACAAPATCMERLCIATMCAGADRAVCAPLRRAPVPRMRPTGGGGGNASPS